MGSVLGSIQRQLTRWAGRHTISLRRARLLTYSQISSRFLILTHFGLNNLNSDNLTPTGQGSNSQLFFHDFWGEFALTKNHSIGAGLHYWNGISRANNQSTLNMLTLDNNRPSWSTLGLSDQFARHLGVYAKGKFGRLQYRVAVNEALTNTLESDPVNQQSAVYSGKELFGKDANLIFQGYFDYNFLDQESIFLPYKVGTYLGTKKVFNVGAGFHLHPSGAAIVDSNGETVGEDVSIFAVDVFYESSINSKNDAVSGYLKFQNNQYGTDFELGPYTTGNMFYGHLGYYNNFLKLQPYVSLQIRTIDAIDDNAQRLGLGANYYMSGHHSKLSFEYSRESIGDEDAVNRFILQSMIYL